MKSSAIGLKTRLYSCSIPVKKGRFITVSSEVSGDTWRSKAILTRFPDALCENMEGAARSTRLSALCHTLS